MGWQIPLLQELRSAGFTIEGLTIGHGTPSIEAAKECIQTIGLKHRFVYAQLYRCYPTSHQYCKG